MNIYGIETFLIGIIASVMIPAFFIYLRKRLPGLREIPLTPTFRQSKPTLQARKSKTAELRKRIELETTITGYLEVYPIVRPEARLS